MKFTAKIVACGVVLLSLSACDESASDKYKELLDFFAGHKIGMNGDYGVFKNGLSGENEPVVAVFGFVDNSKTCEDIANKFNEDEPGAYHCQPLQQS